MTWYVASLAVLLHVFCWGAGLAIIVLPRAARRLWPAFALPAGLLLQVLVVAWMEFFPVAGTDAHARPLLVLPVAFAVLAWWRCGRHMSAASVLRFARCWWGLGAVLAGIVAVLLVPLQRSGLPVTSVALTSCDAGDYAGGVRLFKEIASGDMGGVIGQVETVRVGTTTDFRAFWKRLNHFGPVAAMAVNASVLGLRVHEVVGVFPVVLLAMLASMVFAWARDGLRFGPLGALVLAVGVGTSPVLAYAIYQGAPAQLMASAGVIGTTWASVRAFEGVACRRAGWWRWSGVLIVGLWLEWTSYHFFVVFALAPALGWVLWRLVRRGAFGAVLKWAVWMGACFVVSGVLMPDRAAGVMERLGSFQAQDFGWPMPGLRPEAWLGAVGVPWLEPATGIVRVVGWIVLAGGVLYLASEWAQRGRRLPRLTLAVGPLAGYAVLLWRAAAHEGLASYNAYKLVAVFLPILVAVLCPWLGGRRRDRVWARAGSVVLGGLLVGLNVFGTLGFGRTLARARLAVENGLPALQAIERLPEVDGVNMRVEHFWSRIWANACLLRKQQYFSEPTYEGRAVSPLRGRFDLRDDIVRVTGPAGEGAVFACPGFVLVDRQAPWFVEPVFGEGWFGVEVYGNDTWRWSTGRPQLVLRRRTDAGAQQAKLSLDLRAETEREVAVRLNGREVWRGRLGASRRAVPIGVVDLVAGDNPLEFDSPASAAQGPTGDSRTLLVALFHLDLDFVVDR